MTQNTNLFMIEEPEELKLLSVNYDTLEYYEVEIYQVQAIDEGLTSHNLLKKGIISILSNYLILQEHEIQGLSTKKTSWLNISLWLVDLRGSRKLGQSSEPFSISLSHICQTTKFIYVLGNNHSYDRICPLLKQICILECPILKDSLRFIKNIGEGSQATVDLYESISEPGSQFAVKTFKLSKEESHKFQNWDLIQNEIQSLRELNMCENIVNLDSVYYTGRKIQLVMRFAKHGSLLKCLAKEKKFSEEQIRRIMAQLILAVDLMHRKGIIHRDIKPENILLMDKSELQICIADLGLACKLTDKKSLSVRCGTPGYTAPEILKGFEYTIKSDIFSIGSFFYNLITGKFLFSGNNMKEVLLKNKFQSTDNLIEAMQSNVSEECTDLLRLMLKTDPSKRPTTEECLDHKWFSIDSQALQSSMEINKQSVHFSSLLQQQGYVDSIMSSMQSSFQVTANYFQNLKFETCNQAFESTNSPININTSSANPLNIRFCYNQIITQNRDKKSSKTTKAASPLDQSVIFSSLLLQNRPNFSSTPNNNHNSKNIDKNAHLRILSDDVSFGNLGEDVIDSEDMDENSSDDSTRSENIESKVINRVQITDLLKPEKSMQNKNKRNNLSVNK